MFDPIVVRSAIVAVARHLAQSEMGGHQRPQPNISNKTTAQFKKQDLFLERISQQLYLTSLFCALISNKIEIDGKGFSPINGNHFL
jgi:hypothetical protein